MLELKDTPLACHFDLKYGRVGFHPLDLFPKGVFVFLGLFFEHTH
jgi:hypothetical protein